MNERPVTRYVTAPDGVNLAYQVTGKGPVDVFLLSGFIIPVDLLWDESSFARFARRMGGFSRTLWSDARGTGASGGDFGDLLVASPGGRDLVDTDLTLRLDAAEYADVVLVATSNGGPVAIRYAATHPDRVAALVLINSYAHYVQENDYPWGLSPEEVKQYAASLRETWGTGASLESMAPSKAGDEGFRAWWARCVRLGLASDQVAAERALGAYARDVRPLLPTLAVPTLVVHRRGDRLIDVGAGRYLAEHIPGAKYVELPGDDHLYFVGDTDALLDEIEEFLTGTHQAPEGDVVTATILFTDIVSSTEQSARLGHRKWTALTDAHDAMVRAALKSHQGREVKTIGDGFLVTFDATTRAVRAATEIVTAAKRIGLQVRAGVHNGDVEVRPDDVVGLAVTISKRICDVAAPGQVLVSESVRLHLIGSGISTSDNGTHSLKGVPDEWRLFAVGS